MFKFYFVKTKRAATVHTIKRSAGGQHCLAGYNSVYRNVRNFNASPLVACNPLSHAEDLLPSFSLLFCSGPLPIKSIVSHKIRKTYFKKQIVELFITLAQIKTKRYIVVHLHLVIHDCKASYVHISSDLKVNSNRINLEKAGYINRRTVEREKSVHNRFAQGSLGGS